MVKGIQLLKKNYCFRYYISICIRFNQANSLHTHRAYVHGENNHRVSCPLCGRLYKTAQLLKRHCKINHQNEAVDLNFPPATSTVSKRQFYCTECGESFSAKYQLKKHLEQHNQLNVKSLKDLFEKCISYSILTVDGNPRKRNGEKCDC